MKIPKGQRCEAYVGWHSDRCGAPVIDRCKEPATEAVAIVPIAGMDTGFFCGRCAPFIRDAEAKRAQRLGESKGGEG